MSDWHESTSRTPIRDRPLQQPLIGHFGPSIRHSGEGRNPEGWGEGIVARSKTSRGEGLVPRWGRGGAWQNPPCQFALPSHNSGFSYLGVPAPAGMSDCYESTSRTPIRDVPSNQPRCRLSTGETCRIVDRWPMADGGMRKCSAGACPPLGLGWGVAESTVPIRCTKPQLPLFIPWCADASRHERLL